MQGPGLGRGWTPTAEVAKALGISAQANSQVHHRIAQRPPRRIYRQAGNGIDACRALLDKGEGGEGQISVSDLDTHDVLCMRTSQKRIAVLTVVTSTLNTARSPLGLAV